MKAKYRRTGADRKALVEKIGEYTGERPVYLGAPTFAYQAGKYHIDREGTVTAEDDGDHPQLIAFLEEAGFTAETEDSPIEGGEPEEDEQEEKTGLTVEMPRACLSDGALENLRKIIASKEALIKKALGAQDLRIEVTEDRIAFPWFGDTAPEEAMAYTRFIDALCRMAREAKRITAKEKPVDNEKYAFRCFLLRLGFIGDAYKADRKILMKDLAGSAAFRNGGKSDGSKE